MLGLVAALTGVVATQAMAYVYDPVWVQFEDRNVAYRGVLAHWTDTNWTGFPCSPQAGYVNLMWTHVRAEMDTAGTYWTGLGFADTKEASGSGSTHTLSYMWEYSDSSGIHNGAMPSGNGTPSPGTSNHDFSLNRIYDGSGVNDCGSASFCWVFRIDGNATYQKICCAGSGSTSPWYNAIRVDANQECGLWKSSLGTNCDTTGMTDPINGLQYKTTSDTWVSWSGQDFGCVDYSRGARGAWNSATSVKGGYNSGTSGSGLGNC